MEYKYVKFDDDLHNIIQELATFDFKNFDFLTFYLDKDKCTYPRLEIEDISLDVDNRKVDTDDVLNNVQDWLMMSFTPSKFLPSPKSRV